MGMLDTRRGKAMRFACEKAIANGVSNINPLFWKMVEKWKNVRYGAGGSTYDWLIRKALPTATTRVGRPLETRTFAERDAKDKPSVAWHSTEATAAINEGDYQQNRANETKLYNMFADEAEDAQAAIYVALSLGMWAPNETSQPGGLSLVADPEGGTLTSSYAGLSRVLATNPHWSPPDNDYGALTIAANAMEIITNCAGDVTKSAKASGQGAVVRPDFAAFSKASWDQLQVWIATKTTWLANAGGPKNDAMFEAGFPNVRIYGCDCFWDDDFGGATGYLDGAAAEEFVVGSSKMITLATTHTKAEGLVTSVVSEGDSGPLAALLAGSVAVFKAYWTLKFTSPIFFTCAYT